MDPRMIALVLRATLARISYRPEEEMRLIRAMAEIVPGGELQARSMNPIGKKPFPHPATTHGGAD
jgi:hypothetical protein